MNTYQYQTNAGLQTPQLSKPDPAYSVRKEQLEVTIQAPSRKANKKSVYGLSFMDLSFLFLFLRRGAASLLSILPSHRG